MLYGNGETGCWDHASTGVERFLGKPNSSLTVLENIMGDEVPTLLIGRPPSWRKRLGKRRRKFLAATEPLKGKMG